LNDLKLKCLQSIVFHVENWLNRGNT